MGVDVLMVNEPIRFVAGADIKAGQYATIDSDTGTLVPLNDFEGEAGQYPECHRTECKITRNHVHFRDWVASREEAGDIPTTDLRW